MAMPQRHRDTELEETNIISGRIIGCAIAVHRILRSGLFEAIYKSAAIEFDAAGLSYAREVSVPAIYKGRLLGSYRLDFVVNERVIVEVKSVERNSANHPLTEAVAVFPPCLCVSVAF